MPYNLIHEPWVPVTRRTGPPEYIPPWKISQTSPGPWTGLAAARTDLAGATAQMLIGLLQATCPPEDDGQWLDWYRQPPSPETLHARFEGLAPFMELTGENPFMQDRDCPDGKEAFPLAQLLPDQPASKTREDNKDHFVKRNLSTGMCAACLAPALYWRQTSMGGFGGGSRDGLRLKSPMTVVVLGPDLWRTLWLNVLNRDGYLELLEPPHSERPEDRFPWMGPVRRSIKGETIFPGQVHPDQLYWPISKSIRVDGRTKPNAICPMCGREGQTLYQNFHRQDHGPLYQKFGWLHPLSPVRRDDDNQPVFVQTPRGGVCFGDWLGVAGQGEVHKEKRKVAPVVEAFYRRDRLFDEGLPGGYRAWVFGLEMKQAKSLTFSDARMPLLPLPPEPRDDLELEVQRLVASAEMAIGRLRGAIKEAVFGEKAKPKYDGGILGMAMNEMWSVCREPFYLALIKLHEILPEHGHASPQHHAVMEAWLWDLCKQARQVFDRLSDADHQHQVNPKTWAKASSKLNNGVGVNTKKLREELGLPNEWQKAPEDSP